MSAVIRPIRGRDECATPDHTSLQFKLEIYQRINREWASELDPYESRVLFAIVDRTIGWGKREARFSAGRLLRGDTVCGPLNMGERTLYRTLASLERKGFIARRRPKDQPDATYYSVRTNRSGSMALNRPKRLKSVATGCKEGAPDPLPHRQTPLPQGQSPLPDRQSIYSNQLTGNQETGSRSAALADHGPPNPEEKIREVVSNAVSANAAAWTSRREAQSTANSAAGVEAAWRSALRDAFPDAVEAPWTARQKGQAKRLASGWIHRRQISFIDFTDWAVRNWTQIMRKHFKWMKKKAPPAVPAFSFYVAMIDQFAECWGEGKLNEWASAKERTEIERMMARGMTFEQATLEHAKGNVAAGLREEMRVREIKVRARSRSADQKLEQAKRLADLSGNAPIHPRSPAALAMIAAAKTATAKSSPPLTLPIDEFPPLAAPMVDPKKTPFD